MRDAEVDPLIRDIVQLQLGSRMDAFRAALAQGCDRGASECRDWAGNQFPHLALARERGSPEQRGGCRLRAACDKLRAQ